MFLETMFDLTPEFTNALGGGLAGGLIAALAGFMIIAVIVGLALYVYTALAWFTIAKKLNHDKAWLAWIPIANFFLLPMLANKDWKWGLIMFIPLALLMIPLLGLVLAPLSGLFIAVMSIIWTWKIYTKRKYPGWLSLIPLFVVIPLLGIFVGVAQLVVLGLIAWADRK